TYLPTHCHTLPSPEYFSPQRHSFPTLPYPALPCPTLLPCRVLHTQQRSLTRLPLHSSRRPPSAVCRLPSPRASPVDEPARQVKARGSVCSYTVGTLVAVLSVAVSPRVAGPGLGSLGFEGARRVGRAVSLRTRAAGIGISA